MLSALLGILIMLYTQHSWFWMVSVEDAMEIVIFVSYCILSVIVFQLYIKNAKNLHGVQVTSVVILTAMFLMFCALTHLSKLWGGGGHRTLTFICAAVSSATALVTINLRPAVDQMLTNRFRAVQLVKDETILDLMNTTCTSTWQTGRY